MYANPPGHQPSPYGHAPRKSGPPPAKKAKSNPIITRYPPPPGYRGPTQPQAPPYTQQQQQQQQPAWQQHHPYPQAGYPGGQQKQQPQPPLPPYTQPQYPPPYAAQHYTHPGYVAPPQRAFSPPYPTQSAPPTTFQPPPQHPNRSARRHNSAPFVSTNTVLLDGNGDPMSPADLLSGTPTDLDEEFDGECYFARHPDEINPELSLGIIEWVAPKPAKRALPSTFDEAELEAIAPRTDPPPEESSSEYFSGLQREEAFLSVRQTDLWHEVKDSVIFREFPAVCMHLISLQDLLANYRQRYDPEWARGPRSPTPALSREQTPSRPHSRSSTYSQAMDMDDTREPSCDRQPGIMDDLEAVLQRQSRSSVPPSHSRPHSRAGSITSHHHRRPSSSKTSRHKPLPPIRDQAQEDVLAALGVTGSPTLVYETPGPAFGPRPSTSGSDHAPSRSNSVISTTFSTRLPPPTIFEDDDHDHDHHRGHRTPDCRRRLSSAASDRSVSSAHSSARDPADPDPDPDMDATPRPSHFQRNNARKRSYADSLAGAPQESYAAVGQDTPKQRSKYARVGADPV